jgi:hypothetical protein
MVSQSHSWLARLGRPAAAGLAVVAACLIVCLVQAVSAQSSASVTTGASSDDKILITPAQLSDNSYGLYLVDCARGTICLYQYVPRDRVLNLVTARRYSFDVQSQGSTPREGEHDR